MPVEPIPCDDGGSTPVEITTCCSPSIASAPLCRADGTTVLLVVRSGCVECGEAAPDPAVVGWVDTATGAFTAGNAPVDAGPCEAGCVDTVCRQLCDDADGDGEADTTYSELWCIRADGTAELVLTYRDDPSVPYAPLAPVDCTYGCPQTETVTLCDDVGPFLRRYTWLQGVASFDDFALDGTTAHVVTGTVGVCDTSEPCEAQSTPAATLGLCLADGTPIAVVVTRDCFGMVTQDGWINLTTGTYAAGDPPLGTMACGNPRSITTAGTFCDVNPGTGDVLGLVLIEYTYGADGAVASVRLVDATTGTTYVPAGEITTCPTGVEQPERDVVQLCDTATDGTATEFLRDYGRDETGTIVGHTDYLLDGTPYTTAGTVGVCAADSSCLHCSSRILCDVDPDPVQVPWGGGTTGTLSNGVTYARAGGTAQFGQPWWVMNVATQRWTFSDTVSAQWSVQIRRAGDCLIVPEGTELVTLAATHTYDPATRRLCGTLANDTAPTMFRHPGTTELLFTAPGAGPYIARVIGLINVAPISVEFERTTCRDCDGLVVSTTDTLLAGTAYTPTGTVGLCSPGGDLSPDEPCRNSSTVLLCNLDPDCQAGGTPTATPEPNPGQFRNWGGSNWCLLETPGEGAAVWTGGSATIGPDVACPTGGGGDTHRTIGVRLTAGSPTATEPVPVTVSLRVTNNGPNPGYIGDGRLGLFDATTGQRLVVTSVASSAPVGHVQTLTLTGSVPAASLAAGNIVAVLDLETYHGAGPKGWTVDEFAWTADVPATECESQFLRTIVLDCATGEAVAVVDTTLDGEPYEVLGDVAQCSAAGGTPAPVDEPRTDVELVALCDVLADGTVTEFLRRLTFDGDGQPLQTTDTLLDGVSPYTVTGTAGFCGGAEPCRNTTALLVCDQPTDGTPTPTVTDTPGAPYYPYTTGVPTAGAQALWDGGTLALPDAAGPQPGTGGTVRTAAAVVQAPRPVCDAGTARVTAHVDVTQLGPDTGCANTGFLGLYNGVGEANRVALALAPVNTPAGWTGTLTVEADVPAADLAAGNVAVLVAFDAYDDSGTTCPPPRRTGWQLSGFDATVVYGQTGCATQFLRTVTVDCETGAVTAVTDTTLDGDPYTVTGEAGQCSPAGSGGTVVEPCGDTEVVQLCDLTYDPQAPIPTSAGDFTLTGNVVAANGGTTLWFAQANQPATGVAELTVSGLLPATLYQFRFASAWIGAGGADPAGNAAIYRLDVLDGATVLATRTRNVSNGSAVFPGGVLSEDLPPLPFIAPATGAVTIRFTDQTTGGGANDRDLFLMPFEVRTAVLTLNREPFLRRFTYDCDDGLTSSQDLGLDGVTPYVVEGEVGQCAADGEAAAAVTTPCDVQNVIQACRCDDADGDGFADTDYVELIGVDCEGALTPLGAYLPDLSAPYTPLAPVDCDQTDQGAPPAVDVQARRVELAAGASWSAAAHPTLQSVTAVAHAGTGTVTTADGTSTLHTSEAATWSVGRADDALLTGPLTIAADTGTVTITFTTGVTL